MRRPNKLKNWIAIGNICTKVVLAFAFESPAFITCFVNCDYCVLHLTAMSGLRVNSPLQMSQHSTETPGSTKSEIEYHKSVEFGEHKLACKTAMQINSSYRNVLSLPCILLRLLVADSEKIIQLDCLNRDYGRDVGQLDASKRERECVRFECVWVQHDWVGE